MARMRCQESGRRVGGWLSNVYEDDYIVEKDDGSCYKRFTTYEEAKLYQDYLQQQENQEKLVFEQKRTADEQKRAANELEALRKAAEEKNRIERERSFCPPFPPPTRQVLDPEFQEWLQFKKATDPNFLMWKRAKEEAARRMEEVRRRDVQKMEEARRRAAREAEQKRIADELVRKKKEEVERRRREEELERTHKSTAVINSVRTEFDVTLNSEFGMKIIVDFHINYLRNKQGQLAAYFWLLNNNVPQKLMDCNKKYYSKDGQVAISCDFTPITISQRYNNIELFLPYDELHLPKGSHNLQYSLEIFDNNWQTLVASLNHSFIVKMGKDSSQKVHKANIISGGCIKTMFIIFIILGLGASVFMFTGIMLGL